MSERHVEDDEWQGEHLAYFLIRLVSHPGGGASGGAWTPSGVVEQLGTGVKRHFASGEDLLRLLAASSSRPANMPAGDGECNAPAGP